MVSVHIISVVEKPKPVITERMGIAAEEPKASRRSPSPARSPESNIVHVVGLVRPYTLGQLKELLNRTGTVAEDGFWIDKIKSHCYAIVSCLRKVSFLVPARSWKTYYFRV